MAFKLPDSIETPEQLHAAGYEVERYIEWLRDSGVRHRVGSKALAEPPLTAETLSVVKSWQGKRKITADSLAELLEYLRGAKPPVLHLVLPDFATPQLRTQLSKWARSNCHPDALITLVADSTIGGGVVIRTDNHVYDYSFRGRLLAARPKLTGIIAHVR